MNHLVKMYSMWRTKVRPSVLASLRNSRRSFAGKRTDVGKISDKDTSTVKVRVSDEGVGIPADVEARIFQPRFTTKPAGKGTGLGLHLARTAMERAGGELHLVGAGDPDRAAWARTEFGISLPAAGGARR